MCTYPWKCLHICILHLCIRDVHIWPLQSACFHTLQTWNVNNSLFAVCWMSFAHLSFTNFFNNPCTNTNQHSIFLHNVTWESFLPKVHETGWKIKPIIPFFSNNNWCSLCPSRHLEMKLARAFCRKLWIFACTMLASQIDSGGKPKQHLQTDPFSRNDAICAPHVFLNGNNCFGKAECEQKDGFQSIIVNKC